MFFVIRKLIQHSRDHYRTPPGPASQLTTTLSSLSDICNISPDRRDWCRCEGSWLGVVMTGVGLQCCGASGTELVVSQAGEERYGLDVR